MSKDISICLSFDFDAISVWAGPRATKSPVLIARGEFGQIGAQRIHGRNRRRKVHDIQTTH